MAAAARERDRLAHLVYELLDAHDDTARLARGLAPDPDWAAHLAYLRDLQRIGRELLARSPQSFSSSTTAPSPPTVR
jgi:hypothetical protein